jgi:hypothetical protein
VSQDEIDAILKQDPFFLTNGKFDPVKFNGYKTSLESNYLQVLPNIRAMAAMVKLEESLRRRFTHAPEQVRAEWARRNDQVRFEVLPLLTRDISIEPEATEAEWAQYYQAHPDQFMQTRAPALRAPPGRGRRPPGAAGARGGHRRLAARGTLPTPRRAAAGPVRDPRSGHPRSGPRGGLTDTISRGRTRPSGSWGRTPRRRRIVGVIAERQPKRVRPMWRCSDEAPRRHGSGGSQRGRAARVLRRTALAARARRSRA